MGKIASLDIETNFRNEAMSIGVVIADDKTFEMVDKKYFVIVDAWKVGGMYSGKEYIYHADGYTQGNRTMIMTAVEKFLRQYKVFDIFAYNASFDKSHLPELSGYMWYDVMAIAAYRQHNPRIPANAELCGTGRLKHGYKVEDMMHLFGEKGYKERHNALQDAIDELRLMRHLNVPMFTYIQEARLY